MLNKRKADHLRLQFTQYILHHSQLSKMRSWGIIIAPLIPLLIYFFISKTQTSHHTPYKSVERVQYNIQTFNATEVMLHQLHIIKQEAEKRGEPFYHDLYPQYFPHPNRIVQQIPAAHKFNEEYLIKYSKPFQNVYKHSDKIFIYFDEDKPLMDRLIQHEKKSGHQHYNVKESMDTREFFEKLKKENEQNTDQGPFYYFSHEIKHLGKHIVDDIESFTENLMVTERGKKVNIWIGGRGSTAQGHYDATHNMYVQLRGSKKFKLFEPAAWRYLYLYPALHPYHRQVQINVENPDLNRFPEAAHVISPQKHYRGPYEITLHAGDLLYIPPYWFHHVEAVGTETSISINIWTGCDENDAYFDMIESPLPFEAFWTKKQKSFAIKYFLTLLLDSMLTEGRKRDGKDVFPLIYTGPASYIQQVLVQRRYNDLFRNGMLPQTYNECASLSKSEISAFIDENKFKTYSKKVADLALTVTPKIRDILVGNYIEKVTQWAVGADQVGAFLSTCF
jgi:hypothetical protein